ALAGLALPLAPTAALVLLTPSCDDEVEAEAAAAASEADEGAEPAPRSAAAQPRAAAEPEAEPEAAAEPGEPPEVVEDAPPPIPLGFRAAGRTIVTYAAPRYGSEMRGRIDSGSAFAIYELVGGTDCS